MPIDIKTLKKLPEEQCFAVAAGKDKIKLVVEYLKSKIGTAFTVKEIEKALRENQRQISGRSNIITRQAITSILRKCVNKNYLDYPDSKNINKKGSFYWYEKDYEGEEKCQM